MVTDQRSIIDPPVLYSRRLAFAQKFIALSRLRKSTQEHWITKLQVTIQNLSVIVLKETSEAFRFS
jgi:hypothetical protein